MAITEHESVMANEIVSFLVEDCQGKEERKVILDCTIGGGGHTQALLSANPKIYVIGLDKDHQAISRASAGLAYFANRVLSICSDFIDLRKAFASRSDEVSAIFQSNDYKFSGIIADLGISSDQLNDPKRGLSFLSGGPLDMRMNQNALLTADEVLNEYSPQQLKRVFIQGGLGRGSFELARAIIYARPIRDTLHFREICERVLLPIERHAGKAKKVAHLATVPFQAVRIEVNHEFAAIKGLLSQVLEFLKPGGRFAAISFHSLEDKLITSAMRSWATEPQNPRGMALSASLSKGKLLTKKALLPTAAEITSNSRARSARMRVFEYYGKE